MYIYIATPDPDRDLNLSGLRCPDWPPLPPSCRASAQCHQHEAFSWRMMSSLTLRVGCDSHGCGSKKKCTKKILNHEQHDLKLVVLWCPNETHIQSPTWKGMYDPLAF